MLTSLALVSVAAVGTIGMRLIPTDTPVVVAPTPELIAPPHPILLLAVAGAQAAADLFERARDRLASLDYRQALRSLDRPPPVAPVVLLPPTILPPPVQAPAPSPAPVQAPVAPHRAAKHGGGSVGKPTRPHRSTERQVAVHQVPVHQVPVPQVAVRAPPALIPAPAPSATTPSAPTPAAIPDSIPEPARSAASAPPDETLARARREAVAAAIARGALGRADQLVREGLELAPDDPQLWLAAADVARARDDKLVALHDLERALELRLRQLGIDGPVSSGIPAGVSLHWGDPPDYRPPVIHVGLLVLAQNTPGLGRLDLPPDLSPPPPAPPDTAPLVPHPLLNTSPTALPAPAPLNPPATLGDPLVARLDRDIAVVRDEASPSVQAGAGFRGRSGASQLDTLTEVTAPLEATVSPGGRGTLKFVATPIFLFAGRVDAGNRRYFGTQALPLGPPGQGVADRHAEGLGLDLGYTLDGLSGDIGVTPLGFRETNAVGGLEWAPTIADRTRLRLTAERRAVTDSLLSYAGDHDHGVARDWGGITRSRGHVTLETSVGAVDLYAGGGYGALDGHHVKSNAEGEAGAGGSFAVFKTATEEARLGLDLVYYGYDRNLRYFTYGQGGYFSPQRYLAALLPLTYKAQLDDDLAYELGATVGVQSYHENRSVYFPLDPALQAASGASYPGRNVFGFAGGAHGSLDYRVTPSLHLGTRADYSHAGDYDDGSALLYARYVFNGLAAP